MTFAKEISDSAFPLQPTQYFQNMIEITNPSQHILRRIHHFDILNDKLDSRVLIDVLEPFDGENRLCVAIPYWLGYKVEDESIVGGGECVNSALNDCLAKIALLSWDEFCALVDPSRQSPEE